MPYTLTDSERNMLLEAHDEAHRQAFSELEQSVFTDYIGEYRDRYVQTFLNSTAKPYIGDRHSRLLLVPNTKYEVIENDIGTTDREHYFTVKVGSLGFVNIGFAEFVETLGKDADLFDVVTTGNAEFVKWVDEEISNLQ